MSASSKRAPAPLLLLRPLLSKSLLVDRTNTNKQHDSSDHVLDALAHIGGIVAAVRLSGPRQKDGEKSLI